MINNKILKKKKKLISNKGQYHFDQYTGLFLAQEL